MVLADGQLGGGADHPLGHVPVGLPGADLEPAGQLGPGQGQRHPVAGREVDRPADHPGSRARRRRRGPTWQYRTGFLNPVSSSIAVTSATTHAVDVLPGRLDRLDFQARRGEPPGHLGGVRPGSTPAVLEQPGQWERASGLHPERPAEPDVTLQGVPDVGHPVPDHQGPLDAQAEREAAVPVGVDAAGDQHPGVHHAAAGQLDPALRPADPARRAAGPGGRRRGRRGTPWTRPRTAR